MCPFKVYASVEEQQWSKRLESVRKDIECLFGRLKGRFRLFKTAIVFLHRESIDNAWFTACIIHNMLLKYDRLDLLEVDMDWEGKDGEADSTTGAFPDVATADSEEDEEGGDAAFHTHRQRLVDHFACKKNRREVYWYRAGGAGTA